MTTLRMPYSGRLLVSHLAAYGLAFVADTSDLEAFVSHDPGSQSFEPVVSSTADSPEIAAAIRDSAIGLEELVEADIDPGKTGNDRRPVIWARATFTDDPERARFVQRRQVELATAAEADGDRRAQGLLAGLGATATWGPDEVKPSHGATALDGVLGNHTSDLVRGVLRPARAAAAAIEPDDLESSQWRSPSAGQRDKTGWTPPRTDVDLVHQWLACLGLALLPVGHQSRARSQTPAASHEGGKHRLTLPILSSPTSVARLRALLALEALTEPLDESVENAGRPRMSDLRGRGVAEVVTFERSYGASAGSSVSFTYGRGRRLDLL